MSQLSATLALLYQPLEDMTKTTSLQIKSNGVGGNILHYGQRFVFTKYYSITSVSVLSI